MKITHIKGLEPHNIGNETLVSYFIFYLCYSPFIEILSFTLYR